MKTVLQISLFLLLFCVNSFAVEQIDVKSLYIAQDRIGLTPFRLVANNSSNQEITYFQADSSVLQGITAWDCPCRIRNIRNSNGFGAQSIRANLGQSSGQVIIYFSTPPTSDQIVFRPTISRKKKIVEIKGQTTLIVSRVEITDIFNNVVAVDNDVNLIGGFNAKYTQSYIEPFGRLFDFTKIEYNFDEPRN